MWGHKVRRGDGVAPSHGQALARLVPGRWCCAGLSCALCQQGAGGDEAHDLVGAFEDLVHAQVADDLLDAVIGEIAIAAKELQGVVRDAEGGVGDEALGHGAGFGGVGGGAIVFPGGLVEEGAGGLEVGFHVGELELHGLEAVEGAAEGGAFAHIGERDGERLLGTAERCGGDVEAAAVEAGHGVGEAAALFAEEVVGRHGAGVELDLGKWAGPSSPSCVPARRTTGPGCRPRRASPRCRAGCRRRCGPW